MVIIILIVIGYYNILIDWYHLDRNYIGYNNLINKNIIIKVILDFILNLIIKSKQKYLKEVKQK